MTYSKLLELIKEMDDKELQQDVIVLVYDEFKVMGTVMTVTSADEDGYPVGTIILT